jgi:hypothetical protein
MTAAICCRRPRRDNQAATRPSSPQRQRNARLQRVQLFLKVAPSIQKHLGGQSCNRLIL